MLVHAAVPRLLRSAVQPFRCLCSSARRADPAKVLLLDPIKLATSEFDRFAKRHQIIPLTAKSREEFLQHCRSGQFTDVKAIYRHFKGGATKVTGLFDKELIDSLPSSLHCIAHNGAGYDQIDVAACTERGIQVANVPVAVDDATADTALFLLLGAIRQFGQAQASLREGRFNAGLALSHDPRGKTLGVLGMGGIGRALATRCRALGMDVQYHNRSRLSPDLEQGAKYVSFAELIELSDVISLNLPLNKATRHIIGRDEFKKMKRSAIVINTARGPVVDEKALVEALDADEIAGCGLDVFENEPKIEPGLVNHPKAFLLPHVGTLTIETQTEMEAVCLRNIDTFIKTGKMPYVVPEQRGRF